MLGQISRHQENSFPSQRSNVPTPFPSEQATPRGLRHSKAKYRSFDAPSMQRNRVYEYLKVHVASASHGYAQKRHHHLYLVTQAKAGGSAFSSTVLRLVS
jgi:hypothetical protein